MFCDVHMAAPKLQRNGWLSAAKRRQKMKVECSNVAPRLWVGSAPQDLSVPIDGIDVVVLCAQEIQPPGVGRIMRFPLPNAELTSREVSIALIGGRDVAQALLDRKRVLVTCAQGRNRSALVAALALGRLTRMNADQLVTLMRTRRRADCLTNEHFVHYLKRFVGDGRKR